MGRMNKALYVKGNDCHSGSAWKTPFRRRWLAQGFCLFLAVQFGVASAEAGEKEAAAGGLLTKTLSKTMPTYGARALSYPRGGLAAAIPMRLIRGVHPVVRVTVNGGRELDVLVDTGANRTFMPPGLFGGRKGQEFIRLERICFQNGVCFLDAMVSVAPTNYSLDRRGYYNGLLGVDLLRHTGLTIDYKHRRMYLGNGGAEAGQGEAIRTTFYMDRRSWRPHAKMTVGSVVFPAILLDTGASFTRLTPAMIARLGTPPAAAYQEMAFSTTGMQRTEIVRLAHVCIDGGACTRDILGQKASWPALGATYFRQFLTTFDFRKRRLILRPHGPAWKPPQSALQRLGLQLDIREVKKIVLVQAGSPAALAGMTIADTLVGINGRPLADLGYLGAHEILENPARKSFDILLRRKDGGARTVRLAARAP